MSDPMQCQSKSSGSLPRPCSPPFVDRQKVDAKRYDSTNPKWNQWGICIVVGQRRARCESGWMVKIMSNDGTYTELDSHWLSAANVGDVAADGKKPQHIEGHQA